jgi:hypothetical protein
MPLEDVDEVGARNRRFSLIASCEEAVLVA